MGLTCRLRQRVYRPWGGGGGEDRSGRGNSSAKALGRGVRAFPCQRSDCGPPRAPEAIRAIQGAGAQAGLAEPPS